MSGTVLGKSCLVLGVVWDVECQGSARSQAGLEAGRAAPGTGTRPGGIELPGGIEAGEARAHQEPGWELEQLPGHRGAELSCPGSLQPLPSPGAAQPQPRSLGHTETPPPALEPPELLWFGEQSSGSSLSFRMPSTDLAAAAGNRGFPEHWHITGRSFNPDPRICREGKNLESCLLPNG